MKRSIAHMLLSTGLLGFGACQMPRREAPPVEPVVFDRAAQPGDPSKIVWPARLAVARVRFPDDYEARRLAYESPPPLMLSDIPPDLIDGPLERLRRLRGVRDVVFLQPPMARSVRVDPVALRRLAETYSADGLLVLTDCIDTNRQTHVPLLSLLTLGLLPTGTGEANAAAYLIHMDVPTGSVIYHDYETRHGWQLALAYGGGEAAEQAARRVRRQVTIDLVVRFEKTWPLMYSTIVWDHPHDSVDRAWVRRDDEPLSLPPVPRRPAPPPGPRYATP